MTSAVTTTTDNQILITKEQLQKRTLSLMVKNQATEEFEKYAVGLITYAVVFKGQNKTDDEIRLMAKIFCKECNERFKYLTVPQIEKAIKYYHYGEYGVTPEGFVKCIEDYYPVSIRIENRRLEEQLQKEEHKQVSEKEFSTEEKKGILWRAFLFWKKNGKVWDLNGQIYLLSREYTNYNPTLTDCKRYLTNAKKKTNEWFVIKEKWRFRNERAVEKDRKFCQSKEYKKRLQSEFREYLLRDFFKRSKWNQNFENK